MIRQTWLSGLLLLLTASGCSHKKETTTASNFTTTAPLRADTTITKEYVAQVQSVKNIELRAQEKGYLQNIYVDEGQYVRAGQLLFRIMPKIYEAELLKSQAEVKEAELEMLNSKTLAEKNIVSKTELALKQAKLDEMKAEMVLARLHLSFTEIRAPFDGFIDRIRFKQGSLIDEGGLLTSLSDNKSVFAYFNMSEPEYLNYKSQPHANEKDNIGLLLANNEPHKYKGTIETVEGEFDNETGTIAFRARFPNPDLLLKHGETGKVQLTVPLKHILLIPQKATYEIQDKTYVFIVDKNNTVHSKNISILYRLPNLYVIGDDLSENDRILLEGVQNVKDDDKVACKFVNPAEVIAGLQLIK